MQNKASPKPARKTSAAASLYSRPRALSRHGMEIQGRKAQRADIPSICGYGQPACLHSCTACFHIPVLFLCMISLSCFLFYSRGQRSRRACLHAHLATASRVSNHVACSGVVGFILKAQSFIDMNFLYRNPGPDDSLPARQGNLQPGKPPVPVDRLDLSRPAL